MSAVAADLNNDGWLDLYVANDSMENYYYENTGNGTFAEKGLALGLALGQNGQGVSSMGPAVGRPRRATGSLDILIPDMDYGSLLVEARASFYDDRIGRSGLAVICGQYTGWGAVLLRLRQRRLARRLHRQRQRAPRVRRGRGARAQQRQGRLRGRGARVGRLLPDEVGRAAAPPGPTSTTTATSTSWWSTPPARRTCCATAAAPATTG